VPFKSGLKLELKRVKSFIFRIIIEYVRDTAIEYQTEMTESEL